MSVASSYMVKFLVLFLASGSVTPCTVFNFTLCPADRNERWTYRGNKGPRCWGQTYPNCNGRNQSPINIDANTVTKDDNLAKLDLLNYNIPITKAIVVNNGHTIQLRPDDGVVRSVEIGGSTYTLRQLHFHWGTSPDTGSEHTINGNMYAFEMHLVHLNEQNQIAVVGVIYKEDKNNDELQRIVKLLPELRFKDSTVEYETSLNLNNLLPENPISYYRYSGSLTTPGCDEGVIWSVSPTIMSVGKSQLLEFRRLYSATREEAILPLLCRLVNNYRPVQPLNDRTVSLSA